MTHEKMISEAFEAFADEAPDHAAARMGLRVRAEIASAFRIPAALQLRPGLNREILNVGRATPRISLNRPGQICGTSGRANREVISARTLTQGLRTASSLDDKTHQLAFLAVLAALRRPSGVPFHVRAARQAGATRAEIISALLVGLPPAGHVVTEALPPAIAVLKAEESSVDEV